MLLKDSNITRPEELGNWSPALETPIWSPHGVLVFVKTIEEAEDLWVRQRNYTPVQPPPWKEYYGTKRYREITERMIVNRARSMVRLAARDGIEMNLGQAIDTVRTKWQQAGIQW